MSVRLNLGHIDEGQPSVADSDTIAQIVLTDADPIFRPVSTFLVSLLAFAALAETYSNGGSSPWAEDDHVVLDASAAGFRLSVLGRPISSAIVRNHWPTSVAFDLSAQPTPYDGSSQLGEFGPFIFSAMQGMFTAFYEDHVALVKAACGPSTAWPAAWSFGRVVRNALSHGGDLDIRGPISVTWRTLRYTQADHGKRAILADLWPGDLILLLKDMQDALPATP